MTCRTICLLLGFTFCLPGISRADIVTAEHVIANPNFGAAVHNANWRGQSFTPLVTGFLTTVELQMGHAVGAMPTADLEILIMGLAGGLPDETNILGSKTIPESAFPENSFATVFTGVDFSDLNINIFAGQQLAIVARSNTGGSPNWYLWGSQSGIGNYAGGIAFFKSGGAAGTWGSSAANDSAFRISVVPEPSGLLIVAGAFGLGVIRRRRHV